MNLRVEELVDSKGENIGRLEIGHLIELAELEVLNKRGGKELLARLGTSSSSPKEEKCWLAYIDEVPVGFLIAKIESLQESFSFDGGREFSNSQKHQTLGVIVALYVHKDARRIGIAGELYNSCAKWFASVGVNRVESYALPGDIAMKSFFESSGYKAISLTMGSVQPFSQASG